MLDWPLAWGIGCVLGLPILGYLEPYVSRRQAPVEKRGLGWGWPCPVALPHCQTIPLLKVATQLKLELQDVQTELEQLRLHCESSEAANSRQRDRETSLEK